MFPSSWMHACMSRDVNHDIGYDHIHASCRNQFYLLTHSLTHQSITIVLHSFDMMITDWLTDWLTPTPSVNGSVSQNMAQDCAHPLKIMWTDCTHMTTAILHVVYGISSAPFQQRYVCIYTVKPTLPHVLADAYGFKATRIVRWTPFQSRCVVSMQWCSYSPTRLLVRAAL